MNGAQALKRRATEEPESESEKRRRERDGRSCDRKDYEEALPADESEDPADCDDPQSQRRFRFRTTCFLKVQVNSHGHNIDFTAKQLTDKQRKELKEGLREYLDAEHEVGYEQTAAFKWKDEITELHTLEVSVQPYIVPPHLWKSWQWGAPAGLLPIMAVFKYGEHSCFWRPIMTNFDELCGIPHVCTDTFTRHVNARIERDLCEGMLNSCLIFE